MTVMTTHRAMGKVSHSFGLTKRDQTVAEILLIEHDLEGYRFCRLRWPTFIRRRVGARRVTCNGTFPHFPLRTRRATFTAPGSPEVNFPPSRLLLRLSLSFDFIASFLSVLRPILSSGLLLPF